MAIAGLVLSGLWVLGIVAVVVFLLLFDKGTVSATEVKAGDCLKELPASGLVITVDTAPCGEPHTGEIFSVMTMPDGDFPGQFAIEEYQNKCAPELAKYSPEAASDPEVGLFVLYPSEDSWGQGDRTVTCIATTRHAPHRDPQEVSLEGERISLPEQDLEDHASTKLAGLALAGVGVAHFTNPQLFDGLTGQAFPRDTRKHVYIDGGIETAIGLGLISRKTRRVAIIGLIGYGAYLAGNVVRNR